jgi:Galactose oxidase, central domain
VLVVGGGQNDSIGQPSGNEVTGSCLLFDPTTDQFAPTGPLNDPRMSFGAALLSSGEVLVVGGGAEGTDASCGGVANCGTLANALASAEVYSPMTGSWTGSVR